VSSQNPLKTFLEIGCADFDTLIPLAEKRGWMGWCVEPVPYFTKKLTEMASGLPVAICQQAISDYDGELEMVTGQGVRWATGCSHAIGDNHVGRRLLEEEKHVHRQREIIKVKCTTLDHFLAANQIQSIDFCKIDIEGHEETILKNYSWRVKPSFIKIEHWHSDLSTLTNILQKQGYTLFTEEVDIYAVL
jgi:FkbM family methyltransferase